MSSEKQLAENPHYGGEGSAPPPYPGPPQAGPYPQPPAYEPKGESSPGSPSPRGEGSAPPPYPGPPQAGPYPQPPAYEPKGESSPGSPSPRGEGSAPPPYPGPPQAGPYPQPPAYEPKGESSPGSPSPRGEGSAPPPYPGPPQAGPYPQPPAYEPKGQPYPVSGQPTYVIPPQANVGGVGPQNVTVVMAPATQLLGPYPAHMACPHCHAQIVTRVEYESGLLAWLLCGGLALFGCIYGCCLIPFCVDSAKNAVHSCPNCSQFIAAHRRI